MEQGIIESLIGYTFQRISSIFFDSTFLLVFLSTAILAIISILSYKIYCKNKDIEETQEFLHSKDSSQNFLQALLDSSPYNWIIWNSKTDGVWYDSNLSKKNLLPVKDRDLTPKDFLDSFIEKDSAKLKEKVLELRENGIPFETRARIRDTNRVMSIIANTPKNGASNTFVFWVSEINSAESLLDTERKLLLDILDTLPNPVWYRNIDGKLGYCNNAYASILETTPEIAIREDKYLWTGDLFSDSNSRKIEGKDSRRMLKQHIIINGARHYLEYNEIRIPEEEGSVGFALDLTQQDQAKRELTRHIQSHREILENLTSGVVIYGTDKRLKFFNHAYVRLYDLDESWLHSEPTISEVLDELHRKRLIAEQADFPAFKKRNTQLFNTLISPQQELIHLPDERTIRMISAPHPMGGLFFVFEDVTTSLVLERQVNTQYAVQKETLDHLYEGVAVFASDNRLRFSNPSFAKLWRLNEDSLVPGCHISKLLDELKVYFDYGDDWEAYRRTMIDNLTDRVAKSGRLNRLDGSVLEFSYVPLPDGAHLLTYSDVSDSNRVERALRERNEALEDADQIKTEFLANVSYELKAPLNTIIGFTEILLNGYVGHMNQQQSAYCKGTLESSQQLLGLVTDIIDLATIEAGYMTLNLQKIETKALLSSLVSMMKERSASLEIKVGMSTGIGIKEFIGDERRLKQALFNLLNNSLRFTPKGGKITISANKVGETIVITVADTGVGIARKDQTRVFKKFERTDNAVNRYAGAGLGLSLVKSLIELHGGRVNINSEEGMGTTVTCEIPLSLHETPQQELLKTA